MPTATLPDLGELSDAAAPAPGLSVMTDAELAAYWGTADEAGQRAAEAVMARRERAERLREAQKRIYAEWYDAARAQYEAADLECRGELVNGAPGWPAAKGDQPGRDDFALWTLPERVAMRFATEELKEWWRINGRLSFRQFQRDRAAGERQARLEAPAIGTDAGLAEAAEEFCAGWDAETDTASGEIIITATEEITDEQAAEFAEVIGGHLADAAVGAHEPAGLRHLGAADTVRPRGDRQQHARAQAGPVRDAGPVFQLGHRRPVMAVSYDDARMKPLERIDLWPGRMPCGDVSLLYGDGAVGKGRMICDLIGRVTTGRAMPLCDDTPGEPGSVIVILPEDDPNEQVAHRLRAAGADLTRVFDLTRLEGGSRFKLSADGRHEGDLAHLRGLTDQLEADGMNPRLVVIDPLAAVLGWGTINTNAGARQLVEPLQDMAKDTGVACLVVAHTVKSGALQGSAGLPQALRTVWKVSRDPDNPAYRVLSLEKANNLPPTEPARYTVQEDEAGAVRVEWLNLEALQDQRMGWRDRLTARRARTAPPAAPVTPQQARAAGCRHSRSKFGTPAQCGDCPARKLRAAAPAPPRPSAPRVPSPVRVPSAPAPAPVPAVLGWNAYMAAGAAPVQLSAREGSAGTAQAVCAATPQAQALAAAGIPLQWQQDTAGVWTAGTAECGFAVAPIVAAQAV